MEEGSPHQFKVERTKKKKKIYSGLGGRRERRSHGKKKIDRKVAKLPRFSPLVERMRNCDLVEKQEEAEKR